MRKLALFAVLAGFALLALGGLLAAARLARRRPPLPPGAEVRLGELVFRPLDVRERPLAGDARGASVYVLDVEVENRSSAPFDFQDRMANLRALRWGDARRGRLRRSPRDERREPNAGPIAVPPGAARVRSIAFRGRAGLREALAEFGFGFGFVRLFNRAFGPPSSVRLPVLPHAPPGSGAASSPVRR